jgi:hypothetical protein
MSISTDLMLIMDWVKIIQTIVDGAIHNLLTVAGVSSTTYSSTTYIRKATTTPTADGERNLAT